MLNKAEPKQYDLTYHTAAQDWNEALPIGNGRIGAIVFGDVFEEGY